MGENSLFMQTMPDPAQLESVEICAYKTDCGSLYTHGTDLLLHHPTSFFLDMSRIIWRE
jgi:hypothetical protein